MRFTDRCQTQLDREVLIELVADLKGMIEDRDEKLKAQTENIHNLELKLAELVGANDLRSAEDRHTSGRLAEHGFAIDELRHQLNSDQAKVIDLQMPLRRAN